MKKRRALDYTIGLPFSPIYPTRDGVQCTICYRAPLSVEAASMI
ncbi:unnamed protein product [Camellia sinensis]